jgi:transposase
LRAVWRTEFAAVDPAQLVFLDETHTPTTLTPRYGRAPGGTRVVDRTPRRKWATVSFIGTITAAGIGAAAMSYPGPIDRAAFDAFVDQQLIRQLRPGQIVVLDNLQVHKSPHARAAIERAGCSLRFLPPYSPDLNPIELMFAQMKTVLRARRPRTYDEVLAATAAAMDAVTPTHARHYFRHAGYPVDEP